MKLVLGKSQTTKFTKPIYPIVMKFAAYKGIFRLIIIMTSAFLVSLLIKYFVVQSYRVNSDAMAATLQKGDHVFILKTGGRFDYNDIVAFRPSGEEKDRRLKLQRVIGLPGERIQISGQNIFIDSVKLEINKQVCFKHLLILKNESVLFELLEKYSLFQIQKLNNFGHYIASFPLCITNRIACEEGVLFVTKATDSYLSDNISGQYFSNIPAELKFHIPLLGKAISLSTENIDLYINAIENYENHEVEIHDNSILIDGKLSKYYVFQNAYILTVCDNRDKWPDIRSWSLIPVNKIEGKAKIIWCSFTNEKEGFSFNFQRFIKPID